MYSPSTPITMSHASATLAEGSAAIASGAQEMSLASLEGSDSSALAVLLTWTRQAQEAGHALRFVDVPGSLASIAELYAVSGLLTGFEKATPTKRKHPLAPRPHKG